VRDYIEVEELVSPEPMTEAELLEEINVRSYLRNGVRVVAHTRGKGPAIGLAAYGGMGAYTLYKNRKASTAHAAKTRPATPKQSRARRRADRNPMIADYNRQADQMNWEIQHGPNDFFDADDGNVYIVPKELNVQSVEEAKKLGTPTPADGPLPLSQDNPYRGINEAFTEVNVQAYTRRGKNGLIQVQRHTRGGARVGARAIRRPANRPERTRLEGYNTKELTGAINDPSNELYQQIRSSSAAAQYADQDRLDAATERLRKGELSQEEFQALKDKLIDDGARKALRRELQLRKRRIKDQGKYKGARARDKAKQAAGRAVNVPVRGTKIDKRRAALTAASVALTAAQRAARGR
jgi:hypothetical protein